MLINKAENKQKASCLMVIWWLLWVSAIVLLEFYYRDWAGQRVKILQGQYWFFAIALLSLLTLLFHLRKRLPSIILSSKAYHYGIVGLFVILGLSAFSGSNSLYGLRLMMIILLASSPFILLGETGVLKNYNNKLIPLWSMSLFCAISACILATTGPVSLAGITLENFLLKPLNRWSFFFIEANGFAGMIALGITVTFYQMQIAHSAKLKYGIGLLVLPILFFVFWKTNSRGSLLWVIVTLFFYGALWGRNLLTHLNNLHFKRYLFTALIVAFLLFVMVLLIYSQEIFVYLRLDQADLTTGRLEIWLMYLEQFKSHPLLGFGFGASDQLMAEYSVKGKYIISGPLNVFFGILGETGILGFSAMLFLWIGGILKAWQRFRFKLDSQDEDFHFAFFLMTILISLAAHQNGEWQVLRVTPFNFLFFFLLSAAWTLPGHGKTRSTNTVDLDPI